MSLDMGGTVVGINSRYPTRQELDESSKYFMSDPDEWYPNNVTITTRHVNSVQHGPTFTSVLTPITNLVDAPFSYFVSALTKQFKKETYK